MKPSPSDKTQAPHPSQLMGGKDDSVRDGLAAEGRKESRRETDARRRHDLDDDAEWLRPSDIYRIYRIPKSTLSDLCNSPDPERRVPSILIKGRRGRKGMRYVRRTDLDRYFEERRVA